MDEEKTIYPGRPPRLGRVFAQSPLYFVTFNTHERKRILANTSVHEAFRTYAEKNLCRGFAVGRYVIMPDHIHFFVRVGMEGKLDQFVRLMKQSLTKAIRCSGGSMKRSCSGGSLNRSEQEERASQKHHYSEGCSGGSMNRSDQDEVVQEEAVRRTAGITKALHRSEGSRQATAATSFWQPGFFDHVMRSHESYSEKWNYVRMNPVRAGLVDDPNAWGFQGEIETIYCD